MGNIIIWIIAGVICVAYMTYSIIKIIKIKKGTWKKKQKEGDEE